MTGLSSAILIYSRGLVLLLWFFIGSNMKRSCWAANDNVVPRLSNIIEHQENDLANNLEFPRVYKAVVPRLSPVVEYKKKDVVHFIDEVDLLKVSKVDEDGLYARVSFIVHSQRNLDFLMDIVNRSQDAASPSYATNIEVDLVETEALLSKINRAKNGDGRKLQTYSTISGYPCFRDLAGMEQLMTDLEILGASIPNLSVARVDIGDSHLKTQNADKGYDIWALNITGNGVQARGMTTEKGVLFVMTGIHAREYAPPELVARWCEMLINGYGNVAEITAILDHTEIHVVLHSNPDARFVAETSPELMPRKNRNPTSAGVEECGPDSIGVDLNRNFPFMWGRNPGSSSDPCSLIFRGTGPASEPEVQAIVNYVSNLVPPGQKRSDPEAQVDTAYPETATGMFFDIHSYGEVIISPWGYVEQAAPNSEGIYALFAKFTEFNGYDWGGSQSSFFYAASGATDDWAYGSLGLMSMTFELGTAFYEDCTYFEEDIVPRNLPALMYAAKVSRLPYSIPKGPDVIDLRLSQPIISNSGTSDLTITAIVSDSLKSPDGFRTSLQTIASARLFIDTHPYDLDANGIAPEGITMTGGFDSVTEAVSVTLSFPQILSKIHEPAEGRYFIFVHATDSNGYVGPVTAAYFEIRLQPSSPPIEPPTVSPTETPSMIQTSEPTLEPIQSPSLNIQQSAMPTPAQTSEPTLEPIQSPSLNIEQSAMPTPAPGENETSRANASFHTPKSRGFCLFLVTWFSCWITVV